MFGGVRLFAALSAVSIPWVGFVGVCRELSVFGCAQFHLSVSGFHVQLSRPDRFDSSIAEVRGLIVSEQCVGAVCVTCGSHGSMCSSLTRFSLYFHWQPKLRHSGLLVLLSPLLDLLDHRLQECCMARRSPCPAAWPKRRLDLLPPTQGCCTSARGSTAVVLGNLSHSEFV